ncbi:MAG: efflux RND transporter periplasmic adaptor subunit [Gammaproteobacteria bacterium]|nr:efflux RND transporter periplasmic adaptor subunit [Gammaproteobacteria bacterium]
MFNMPLERSLAVNKDNIAFGEVISGTYEDFISLRGRVTPARSIFLDIIEGGRVERVFVEDGINLKAGDLIAELSNTSLLIDVTRNEAIVAEQLNNMRSIELSLEQNRLLHKRNLIDINYQIKMFTRKLASELYLQDKNLIAANQVDDTHDTLTWYKDRLKVTLESQKTDARMQEQQLYFLKTTGQQLQQGLSISRKNLDSLNVKAPVDGKLSGFDIEVGQSIDRGERLGQIDTPDNYKLIANIDEFYLTRVDIGQGASYDSAGISYDLTIAKIYPQVINGQFRVDLKFVNKQPIDIRRGQTLHTKLTLSNASTAKLIPNGAYFQSTGGNWVFVVSADGQQAIKRNIRSGRRNDQFIEVLEGLEVGERVVISPYTTYQNMERLKLGS